MRILAIAVVVSAGLLAATRLETSAAPPSSELQAMMKEVVNEADWYKSRVARRNLFDNANDDLLKRLAAQEEPSIAILAAWEIVYRPALKAAEGNAPFHELTSEGRAWFLGFLEGRLRRISPLFWRRAFSQFESSDRRRFIAFDEFNPFPSVDLQKVRPGDVFVPKGQRIEKIGGQNASFRLVIDSKTFDIPSSILPPNEEGIRFINVIVDQGQMFVAVRGVGNMDYVLYCVDLDDRKQMWKADVWGCRSQAAWGEHSETIEVDRDAVYVYGVARLSGLYVEVFDRTAGRNLVRVAVP